MMPNRMALVFFVFIHLAPLANSLDYSTNLGPNSKCDETRMFYLKQGLSLPIPDKAVPGTELSICQSEHTCCTKAMEDELIKHSISGFKKRISDITDDIYMNYEEFDDYFQVLIENSKVSLDTLFEGTYKSHYTENSAIFMSLFDDIENYYSGGVVDLRDIFDSFFTTLMQQVFKLMQPGSDISDDYMQCIADNMHVIQPFGDISEKLSKQMQRAFINAKTFVHGLAVGEQVVANLAKVYPSKKCVSDLVTMNHCPKCNGDMLKPCHGLCVDVMKGCLCDLGGSVGVMWGKYIDAMMLLLVRLDGPFNIESVLKPLDVKISEAIMLLQDNWLAITETVTRMCGDVNYGQNTSSEYEFNLEGLSNLKLLGSLGDMGNSDNSESEFGLGDRRNSEAFKSLDGLDFFDDSASERPASDLEKHADISKRSIDERLEGDRPLRPNKKHNKKNRKRKRKGRSHKKGRNAKKGRRGKSKRRDSQGTVRQRYASITPTSAVKPQTGLKSMVEGVRSTLSRMKHFWRNLSQSTCQEEAVEKENCWNGGGLMQERTCESFRTENITQWRVLIQPQVRILAETTFKVKQAYHGIDPMLSENDDDAYFTDISSPLGEEGTYSGEVHLIEGSAEEPTEGQKRKPDGGMPFDMEKTEEKTVGDLEPRQIKWIEQTLGESVASDTSLSEIQERLAQHPDAWRNDHDGEKFVGGFGRDSQGSVTRSTTTSGVAGGGRLEGATFIFSVALCYFTFSYI